MDLIVLPSGQARWGGLRVRCALGRGGITRNKREGDGATPIGKWPMSRLLYRADRVSRPKTRLDITEIRPEDGWCDDPADPAYNQPVKLPYAGRHERLWREDEIYDLLVVLGYNDNPVVPGLGSAIFLHVARPDYSPTEGCVALARSDLERVLAKAQSGDRVVVEG
jgi:L,D-peptidoglycan transpeptidase YkuD (ErfK/YbiS/YcfS/YnhG family)